MRPLAGLPAGDGAAHIAVGAAAAAAGPQNPAGHPGVGSGRVAEGPGFSAAVRLLDTGNTPSIHGRLPVDVIPKHTTGTFKDQAVLLKCDVVPFFF